MLQFAVLLVECVSLWYCQSRDAVAVHMGSPDAMRHLSSRSDFVIHEGIAGQAALSKCVLSMVPI